MSKTVLLSLLFVLFLTGCVQETPVDNSISTEVLIPPPAIGPSIPAGEPHGWEVVFTEIYSTDFETTPVLGLLDNLVLTTDSISGDTSVMIDNQMSIQTNPNTFSLLPDTRYLFEFDYRIIERGVDPDKIVGLFIYPTDSMDSAYVVAPLALLSNADQEGRFSTGALTTTDFDSYYLLIQASQGALVIIDNLRIYRLDTIPTVDASTTFFALSELPFPRLGNYIGGMTEAWAHSRYTVPDWPERYVFTAEEVEQRLALFDIIVGPSLSIQNTYTGFVKKLREINPNVIVLPYMNYIVTTAPQPKQLANIDPDYEFYANLPDEWVMKHTNGSKVGAYLWPGQFNVNIYDSCPVVNGQTYDEAITDHMLNTVMASGFWDGVFIDNAFSRTSHYVPNFMNPSLFDYDVNLNGLRDETIAEVSEVTRPIHIHFLQKIKNQVGDNELIIVNHGWNLDYHIAPYVNGIVFELFQKPWRIDEPYSNEFAWRRFLDDYYAAEELMLEPGFVILEAGSGPGVAGQAARNYLEPTNDDIKAHRFSLGTALLGDGFYEFDLYDMGSVPYWFDEYSVNQAGTAVEGLAHKGYLGHPITDAVELSSTETLLWSESFDSNILPVSFSADTGVFVDTNRLVIDNPDHTTYKPEGTSVKTVPGVIPFELGKTYVIEFDWEVLETLDVALAFYVETKNGQYLAQTRVHGVFKGDSNQEHFHITIPDHNEYSLKFTLLDGGGKVAIDNIRVFEGGAGPWRRDFENGFVLVNPLNKPYTFTNEELAGDLFRSTIKRILGSQAPDVNTGELVTDSLTLDGFDAILLLADSI